MGAVMWSAEDIIEHCHQASSDFGGEALDRANFRAGMLEGWLKTVARERDAALAKCQEQNIKVRFAS